jgi:hypothetical protein
MKVKEANTKRWKNGQKSHLAEEQEDKLINKINNPRRERERKR